MSSPRSAHARPGAAAVGAASAGGPPTLRSSVEPSTATAGRTAA